MKKFDNFLSNLAVLEVAHSQDLTNEFIVSGIIDKFFIQFELSWKVLKELMQYEGKREAVTGSPRQIIKAAYTVYDFMDEDIWLSMLDRRNDMTHIYDGEEAIRLVKEILETYIPVFQKMKENVIELYGEQLEKMT